MIAITSERRLFEGREGQRGVEYTILTLMAVYVRGKAYVVTMVASRASCLSACSRLSKRSLTLSRTQNRPNFACFVKRSRQRQAKSHKTLRVHQVAKSLRQIDRLA